MKTAAIASGLVFALVAAGYMLTAPSRAHNSAVERIMLIAYRGRLELKAGADEPWWRNQLHGVIRTAISNHFLRPKDFSTDKLEKLADLFEARWPNGPRNTADLLEMVNAMEAAKPDSAGYQCFETVREYCKEHEITSAAKQGK